MPIYKRCTRCNKRLLTGTKCDCYNPRYKEEDKYKKGDQYSDFYNTGDWKVMREKTKHKTAGMDIYSYYILGIIEYGTTAHHIQELKENWSRRLDISNLIYLTDSNHQLIHKEYRKGRQEKKAMQTLLYDLLERYYQEFNN